MKVEISYNIKKDLENYRFQCFRNNYDYGRASNYPQSLVREVQQYIVSHDNLEEAKTLTFIEKSINEFKRINKDYLIVQRKSLEKLWLAREDKFSNELGKYFNVNLKNEKYNGYFTSVTPAPYDVRTGSFYILLYGKSLATQINNICHELLHIVFLRKYYSALQTTGLSESAILDINESLTVLLNLQFKECLITPEINNKPSTLDLQNEIVSMYKAGKDFEKILEKLITIRLKK